MADPDKIKDLQDRVEYLEENRRYIQNALETVLSLGDFQTSTKAGFRSNEAIFEQAARKINSIINFSSCTYYIVDEETFLFEPAYCDQHEHLKFIEKEVDFMIDQGFFAWAVREKRGVMITSQDHSRQFLLHVVSGDNRIRGMFVGLLPENKASIADTSLTLLSITLLRVANAIENLEFYYYLQNQADILEKEVAARTEALTRSERQLKKAMDQATELAKKAKKASEAKSDFLAKMSHELRTPLNGIIGMAEIALSTQLDDRQKQILQIIDKESNVLLRIISDILDFSKVEAGKMEIENRPFDLRTILDEVADTIAPKAHQKGLELISYLPPEMPTQVKGDAMRVKQVLLNLAGNALKFTEQGEIHISGALVEHTDQAVHIEIKVKDSGIGIAPDKQATIFDGFTQADESTTRKYGGTGLGITISKQLVELMGGRLSLESQKNQGSTFTFDLVFESDEITPESKTSDIGAEHGTALVIDPCESSRSVLTKYLSAMGCLTIEACEAKEALMILASEGHDRGQVGAIFGSLRIPEINDESFYRSVLDLDLSPRPAIVGITGLENMAGDHPSQAPKIDFCLAKPIKLYDLERIVQKLCHAGLSDVDEMETPSNQSQASITEETNAKDIHILLVDDYPTNQQVASLHLTTRGYQVDIADNGHSAVAAFEKRPYDLVLMDVQMPVMDGYEATDKIRKWESQTNGPETPTTPIVAMTAHALKGNKDKCLSAGMDDFITKPIRRETLLKTVAKWVHRVQKKTDAPNGFIPSTDPDTTSDNLQLPIDFPTAVDEFGDKEIVLQVADQLMVNARRQIQIMRDALQNGDAQCIQNEAHAIKGGAWTIEARPLGNMAESVEHLGRDNRLTPIEALLYKMDNEILRLEAHLETHKQ